MVNEVDLKGYCWWIWFSCIEQNWNLCSGLTRRICTSVIKWKPVLSVSLDRKLIFSSSLFPSSMKILFSKTFSVVFFLFPPSTFYLFIFPIVSSFFYMFFFCLLWFHVDSDINATKDFLRLFSFFLSFFLSLLSDVLKIKVLNICYLINFPFFSVRFCCCYYFCCCLLLLLVLLLFFFFILFLILLFLSFLVFVVVFNLRWRVGWISNFLSAIFWHLPSISLTTNGF